MIRRRGLAAFFLFAVLLWGCGGPPRLPDEIAESVPYETVYVDPEIVFADSLITLIRADRIDSIVVEEADFSRTNPGSLDIRIVEPACNVAISLMDADLNVIRPLMVRILRTGFYRFSFSPARMTSPRLYPGPYFLKADYCDSTEMVYFAVD